MGKWFYSSDMDSDVIISSRVRLARNIKKYPFSLAQTDESANAVLSDVIEAVKRAGDTFYSLFDYIDINRETAIDKLALINKHAISPEFFKKEGPKGLLLRKDEQLSIMINEEDHIRLQGICAGADINKAFDIVDKIDDLIEETVEYAFDKDFGYLTACPTNTGTGLRASYMAHIPLLESTGEFRNIMAAIGKFGITVRGIYGEGTQPMGSIYQISNQVTMGKNEDAIIKSLVGVTSQIMREERKLREKASENIEVADRVWRAYGILNSARKLTLKEAIKLLSDVRLGFSCGILSAPRPKINIYAMMMNIQNGLIQQNAGCALSEAEGDIIRADYLRQMFNAN